MKKFIGKLLNEDWVGQGNQHAAKNNHEKAIECYNKALAIDSNDHKAWLCKGQSYFSLCKYDEAIKSFNESLRLNSKNFLCWNAKGQALEWNGNYGEALSCLNKALELSPGHQGTLECIAQVYTRQGKHHYALEIYNNVLKLYPNAFLTLGNKISTLVHMGKWEEARSGCDELLRNPSAHMHYHDALGLKGVILIAEGKFREAIAYFEKAKKFKEMSWISACQGISYFCLHEVKTSLVYFQEALSLGTQKFYATTGLAVYEYSIGNTSKASQLLSQAEVMCSTEWDIMAVKDFWFFRGLLFVAIKAYPQAQQAFEKLLTLDSSHQPAKTQLAAIQKPAPANKSVPRQPAAVTKQGVPKEGAPVASKRASVLLQPEHEAPLSPKVLKAPTSQAPRPPSRVESQQLLEAFNATLEKPEDEALMNRFVKLFVDAQNPNFKMPNGDCVLHCTVAKNRFDLLKVIVAHKQYDHGEVDQHGATALFVAVAKEKTNACPDPLAYVAELLKVCPSW